MGAKECRSSGAMEYCIKAQRADRILAQGTALGGAFTLKLQAESLLHKFRRTGRSYAADLLPATSFHPYT